MNWIVVLGATGLKRMFIQPYRFGEIRPCVLLGAALLQKGEGAIRPSMESLRARVYSGCPAVQTIRNHINRQRNSRLSDFNQ